MGWRLQNLISALVLVCNINQVDCWSHSTWRFVEGMVNILRINLMGHNYANTKLLNKCWKIHKRTLTTHLYLALLSVLLNGRRHQWSSVLSLWGAMTDFGGRVFYFWDALYWSCGCFHGERSRNGSCHGTQLSQTLPAKPWTSSELWLWCLTKGWRVKTRSWVPCPEGPVDRWVRCMFDSRSGLAAWRNSGAGSYLMKEKGSVTQKQKGIIVTPSHLLPRTTWQPVCLPAAPIRARPSGPPQDLHWLCETGH